MLQSPVCGTASPRTCCSSRCHELAKSQDCCQFPQYCRQSIPTLSPCALPGHDKCRERHHPSPMGQPDLTRLSKPPEHSLSPALPLLPQWDHFSVFALQELLCCVGFAQCSGQIIAALLCSPRCPWGFSSLLWVMLLVPGSLQKR